METPWNYIGGGAGEGINTIFKYHCLRLSVTGNSYFEQNILYLLRKLQVLKNPFT